MDEGLISGTNDIECTNWVITNFRRLFDTLLDQFMEFYDKLG